MNVHWNALNVQDATFLTGVVYQMARDITRIHEQVKANGGGWDEVNQHPACQLYAKRIAWLAGLGGVSNVEACQAALEECVANITPEERAKMFGTILN